jgi:DNA-binding LacI/PurR family transcriptional regulator
MREALPANPFCADVFHGNEQVCHEFRINLSFSSLDVVNGRLRSLPALINDERVSGIALVGFDDVPAASVIEPTLTTVRQPNERLALRRWKCC